MTGLYALDLTPYLSGGWRELLPELPEQRQTRTLACRFEADRARVAGAGWLLQHALEQAGIPASQQEFSENHWGKPFLTHRTDVQFSLSHGGSWAVCAVGEQPLGVDVELPRCSIAVARRWFHPEEVAAAGDPDTLCRLWTAKEAFVKALGTGFSTPLNSFVVRLDPIRLEQTHSPLDYRLYEYHLPPCRLCLCTTEPRPTLTIVTHPA